MKKFIYIICVILVCTPFLLRAEQPPQRDKAMIEYKDVQDFIETASRKHKFDKAVMEMVFSGTYFDYSVIALLDKPAEHRPWADYSTGIISADRVSQGGRYIKTHVRALEKASKEYGVPANVIVSIIGIESTYGTAAFKRDAVQSLSTIAFEYPRRAEYFKGELEKLFILAHKTGTNPKNFMGSYAGALGIPQFMPSSALLYAKDGDGDGRVDIINNHADAIASVANYLKHHGWKKDKKIAVTVTTTKALNDNYYSISPCSDKGRRSVKEWKNLGVKIPAGYADSEKAVLSKLTEDEEKGSFTNVLFFENACPVHKYNRSLKYVAVVSMLADRLK